MRMGLPSLGVLLFLMLLLACKSDSGGPAPPAPDTTVPTVSITSPTNNSTVIDSVLVTVTASDNVAVEKVEFYIDGNLTHTRSSVPWQYNWNVRNLIPRSLHTIQAKAYDASNNIGSSTMVAVTVIRTEQALQFNGSTDYVRLPSSTSLTSFSNQITVEAWVRVSSYASGGIIIASGNQNEYSLAVRPNGKLGVTMARVNPQANAEFISKSALSLNSWYHVAFTYDGSLESIYINALVDTSFSVAGTISSPQITENISIGVYSYNNHSQHNSFLNGTLDEVRVWNVSRSSTQIQAMMSSELTGSEAGLVGYWKFNGNVADSSPNDNNGTIFGNPTFVSVIR